ncbi:hypothetical protein GCM10027610_032180 [Dactylosporangium cerinum]
MPERAAAICPEASSQQQPHRGARRVFIGAEVGICGRMRTALHNVRVFDGRQLLRPGTVLLDGDRIGSDPEGVTAVIDGEERCSCPG